MKETFFNLSEEKKNRIISAALSVFSSAGYEKTSLDVVIKEANISKGGLYEYIESKDDLFTYILNYSYNAMFTYIQTRVTDELGNLPADPLERTRCISAVAVEFYIEQPHIIAFISSVSQTSSAEMRAHVQHVLDSYFNDLYSTCGGDKLGWPSEQIISLLKWLLVKTRSDFLSNMKSGKPDSECRILYLGEWDFFLSVLAGGIYRI